MSSLIDDICQLNVFTDRKNKLFGIKSLILPDDNLSTINEHGYVLEILKYLLPALVVFATTFYMVKKYFDGEEKKRQQQTFPEQSEYDHPVETAGL